MGAKDDNGYPVLYGVSHVDGITPVQIHFDPTTRQMSVDDTTTIQFDPLLITLQNPNTEAPFALATSSADNKTVAPWVVNASTGAVLIDP